ncbi:MAG: AhpC/TSA family protein [Bacteroidetes bacterium]|nr:MAG: AhpC/TSA family protein [Bacteroidota bacterium]
MKLILGQTARDFKVKNIYGQEISLKTYSENGKKVLLTFFRNTACPFCNLRVHELTKSYEKWKDKMEMIFFFDSKQETILRSTFHSGISPIPLISDPQRLIYEEYGIEKSLLKMMNTFVQKGAFALADQSKSLNLVTPMTKNDISISIPADFLINLDFKIENLHYGKHLADHLEISKIKEFAEK